MTSTGRRLVYWFIKPFFKKRRGDIRLLSLCFLVSSLFWVFNRLNTSHTAVMDYPVELKYDKAAFVPTADVPDKIKIQVSGYGWHIAGLMAGLRREPVQVDFDAEKSKSLQITPENFRISAQECVDGVSIDRVLMDALVINFEKVMTRKVYIKIDANSIDLADGCSLGSVPTSDPAYLTFHGAESEIKKLGDTLIVAVPDKDIHSDYRKKMMYDRIFSGNTHPDAKFITISFNVTKN